MLANEFRGISPSTIHNIIEKLGELEDICRGHGTGSLFYHNDNRRRHILSLSSSCSVVDLVYWRNVRRTAIVFTGLVIGLASVFQLSAITVLSHICLGAMCVTFPLRLYYKLLELLRWNPGVHPFQ